MAPVRGGFSRPSAWLTCLLFLSSSLLPFLSVTSNDVDPKDPTLLFGIPSPSDSSSSGKSGGAGSSNYPKTGAGSGLSANGFLRPTPMKQRLVKAPQEIGETTLMGLQRREMQFLSCGVNPFGNSIPIGFDDYVHRLANASQLFRRAHPSIDRSQFDWSVPVMEGSSGRTVKWSDTAKRLGVGSVDDKDDGREIFHSNDMRHRMPLLKLAVKEDTLARAFDIFLFAPDETGRVSGNKFFKMGSPLEDIEAHVASAEESQQSVADRLANELNERENELSNGPENNMQPVAGLKDKDSPFFALMSEDTEKHLHQAELDLIRKAALETAKALEKQRAEQDKTKQLVNTAVSGVTGIILEDSTQKIIAGVPGVEKPLVKDPKKLQDGVEFFVDTFTGGPTKEDNKDRLIDSIARLASRNGSAADIERIVANAAQAAGKTSRRLLLSRSQRAESRRRKLAARSTTVAAVPASSQTAGRTRRRKSALGRALMTDPTNPFMFGDVTIKDGDTGAVLYGPVVMPCPYLSIPRVDITGSASDVNAPAPPGVLLFEVAMRTQAGDLLADELGRRIVLKKVVVSGHSGATEDGVSDSAAKKCPQLVLGLRALDVDFSDFNSTTDRQTKHFVRKTLARTLNVDATRVTFCSAKRGSTVVGFDASKDLTLRWDGIVADRQDPIHRLLQVDSQFPTFVDKDDLYGERPTLTHLEEGPRDDEAKAGDDDDEQFELVNLPIFDGDEGIDVGSLDGVAGKDNLVPLPELKSEEQEPQGLEAWVWALLVIIIIVAVVVVAAGITLFVLHQRRKKKQAEREVVVSGKPVDLAGDATGTKAEQIGSNMLHKQKSGIVVGEIHDSKGSATHINRVGIVVDVSSPTVSSQRRKTKNSRQGRRPSLLQHNNVVL